MTIRVVHIGLGPIGAAVARQVASRKGFQIVGAVDIDPNKAGRDLGEQGGSLTLVATVLADSEAGEEVRKVLETTENSLVRLSAELAAAGVTPSIVLAESRLSGEEELRSPDQLERLRELRGELAGMEPEEAARHLGERLEGRVGSVTRIARGISAGSTLEYSDRTVVGDAISGRREF